jgi:release factor glutamine methyltransferase
MAQFTAWLNRRQQGEPIAYLLGWREFWSLPLEVTPDTLVPRPETELLVELALARLPADQPLKIADLGTGSGAIALALARERPQAAIIGTDISPAALQVARRNGVCFDLNNIEWRQGDWLTPLADERFDLIVSNPPYIAATDNHWREGELRFEPFTALVSGVDGLQALRTLIAQAPNSLRFGGWLLLEHGYDQGESVPALLTACGFVEVADHQDGAGLSRCSSGRWMGHRADLTLKVGVTRP